MGLKHLTKIGDFMSRNKEKWFPITDIKDSLNIYYYTVKECLEYFHKEGRVQKKEFDNGIRYRWIR